MSDTLLTHLQVFGIGFSLGIAGPCILTCMPILMTYIAGSQKGFAYALKDIFTFTIGRLSAYLVLGTLAGLSASLLRQFVGSNLTPLFKQLAGLVGILFGIFILIDKRPGHCDSKSVRDGIYSIGGLFTLGFIMGIAPCAPLWALLLEITLISKGALEGLSYGLSFGLGTSISTFIVVGALAGILAWLPSRIFKSKFSVMLFRMICSALLILFGISLILGRYRL